MFALFADPAIWVSLLTLVVLEIVLGIDNVIFLSIISSRLPPDQRRKARLFGLALALVARLGLLAGIAYLASLTRPWISVAGHAFSGRDVILLLGGLFLIWKATSEIFGEVEGKAQSHSVARATMGAVIAQIILIDVVFSLDSIITAIGIADHLEVMVAAVVIAVCVMMVAAEPVSRFVEDHPSTKMLALAFLVMIGMALVADGFGAHIDRAYIYATMVFSVFVEALNLLRAKRVARGVASGHISPGTEI